MTFVFGASADAAPRKTALAVEREAVQTAEGTGCSTATIAETFSGSPTNTWPGVGDHLHGRAYVLGVDTTGRRVTWTVGPNAETCASTPGQDWSWWTGYVSFGAVYRARLHLVRATRRDGIRSIAGLPTRWRGRQGPSIRLAARHLGRPTSVHGSRWGRDICHVRWARLGLRGVFANFGGRPACKAGWLQTATISGSRAREWAVKIEGNTSTAVAGTSLRYLREEQLVRYHYVNDAWSLSQDWLPYGEAGYYSTVSARLGYDDPWDGSNPVRGFDLYIGAAGD